MELSADKKFDKLHISNHLRQTFLSLVRLGIGNALRVQLPKDVDWDALDDLAARQGLIAIMVDAIERLPEGQCKPPIKDVYKTQTPTVTFA